MFKGLNQKISLGAMSAAAIALPNLSLAATVRIDDGDVCDGKKVFLNGCKANCIDGKTISKTSGGTENCIITYGKETATIGGIITNIVTWLTTLVGIIAVLFLIYGGLVYITSAGNKDRAENAKKIITYSVLGLIVVVLARIIVSLVVNTAGEAI